MMYWTMGYWRILKSLGSTNIHVLTMKSVINLIGFILLLFTFSFGQTNVKSSIKGYYCRLPFDDSDCTGKYADILVDIPEKGRFVFCREYSYQPFWQPKGGKRSLVDRLIPRKGDGPDERPDKHNICSNASIVGKTDTTITVHWRYAPDLTKESFVDFLSAYNKVGNPSPFYSEYADEYFTVHENGWVKRTVRNGCYKLDEWNDPKNQTEQLFHLTSQGIVQQQLDPANKSGYDDRVVLGGPVRNGRTTDLFFHMPFNEGRGQDTREVISDAKCPVEGVNAYWKEGVSGTCLSFDSYSNAIILPASMYGAGKENITVSAWIAPREYPFNLAAIVDHRKDNDGYLLGMDAKGRIVFKVGSGVSVHEITSCAIPLYEWTHVVGVIRNNDVSVYINGEQITPLEPMKDRFLDAQNGDLSIGMTRSFTQSPYFGERSCTKQFKSNMVFSGLIDEVKIFSTPLFNRDVKNEYEASRPSNGKPLKPLELPAGPKESPGFGAQYVKLAYSPEWDGLWRVGNYTDILVTFDHKPWRYVFWRGTRYLPSLVTGCGPAAIWSNDQGPEDYFQGQCHEHMSDMLCRFSNARIIHASEARILVHWRNSSASIEYKWPAVDPEGRGIWTDEYWSIYPDGTSVRHQMVHNNTGKPITGELNQNEILHQPGQTTEDLIHDDAVIIVNTEGEKETRYRSAPERRKLPGNWNLQFLNLNSETKQFQIGEIGSWIQTFLHSDTYWRGWNHYPVQLIPSDGTRAYAYDRPVSSCPSTFYEYQHKNGENIEAMVMYGLTTRKPEELTALNRSWNFSPQLITKSGCTALNYNKAEKAYYLKKEADVMKFQIPASKESPLVNPAFVIHTMDGQPDHLEVEINDKKVDFKKGIELDTEGNENLVIWIPYTSESNCSFKIHLKNN